jgi:hypothetical protein
VRGTNSLTRLSLLITSLVCFFIRADNLQRVLFVVGSCHLNPWAKLFWATSGYGLEMSKLQAQALRARLVSA